VVVAARRAQGEVHRLGPRRPHRLIVQRPTDRVSLRVVGPGPRCTDKRGRRGQVEHQLDVRCHAAVSDAPAHIDRQRGVRRDRIHGQAQGRHRRERLIDHPWGQQRPQHRSHPRAFGLPAERLRCRIGRAREVMHEARRRVPLVHARGDQVLEPLDDVGLAQQHVAARHVRAPAAELHRLQPAPHHAPRRFELHQRVVGAEELQAARRRPAVLHPGGRQEAARKILQRPDAPISTPDGRQAAVEPRIDLVPQRRRRVPGPVAHEQHRVVGVPTGLEEQAVADPCRALEFARRHHIGVRRVATAREPGRPGDVLSVQDLCAIEVVEGDGFAAPAQHRDRRRRHQRSLDRGDEGGVGDVDGDPRVRQQPGVDQRNHAGVQLALVHDPRPRPVVAQRRRAAVPEHRVGREVDIAQGLERLDGPLDRNIGPQELVHQTMNPQPAVVLRRLVRGEHDRADVESLRLCRGRRQQQAGHRTRCAENPPSRTAAHHRTQAGHQYRNQIVPGWPQR